MPSVQLFFSALIWSVFFLHVRSAIRNRKRLDHQARLMWLLVFTGCVGLTLWGESTGLAFDRYFGGRPVSIYVKFVCAILIVHLYYLALQIRFSGATLVRYRRLRFFLPFFIVAITAVFLLLLTFDELPLIPRDRWRLVINGTRDLVMATFMIGLFVPANLSLMRDEEIPEMKIKHGALLLIYIIYSIGGILTFAATVFYLVGQTGVDSMLTSILPLLYVALATLFIIALIPHRWLSLVSPVIQLYRLYRLKGLEGYVIRATGIKRSSSLATASRLELMAADRRERAIYQTTIAILDIVSMLGETGDSPTLAQIRRLTTAELPYPDLVRELVMIDVE